MSRLGTLKVEYGITADDRIVTPEAAVPDDDPRCPGCREPLLLRGGGNTRYRRHFYHQGGSGCGPETVLHNVAKHLAASALREAIAGGRPITVDQWCSRCPFPGIVEWRGSGGDSVRTEQPLESGRIADVAVLKMGIPIAAVEIHVTNAVSAEKAKDLGALPWIELDAVDVVADPHRWQVSASRARRKLCRHCVASDAMHRAAGIPEWTRHMRPRNLSTN